MGSKIRLSPGYKYLESRFKTTPHTFSRHRRPPNGPLPKFGFRGKKMQIALKVSINLAHSMIPQIRLSFNF